MNQSDQPIRVAFDFAGAIDLDAPPEVIPDQIMTAMAVQMWKQLMTSGYPARAVAFLDTLPAAIAFHQVFAQARKRSLAALPLSDQGMVLMPDEQLNLPGQDAASASPTNAPPVVASVATTSVTTTPTPVSTPSSRLAGVPRIDVGPGKLRIVFWTGPAWEPWSPRSIDEGGIGGSETAAAHLARELAGKGHQVIVAGHCDRTPGSPLAEGCHDGVRYVHYDRIGRINCDVLVVSRQAPALLAQEFKARLKYLWVHDIHVGEPSPLLHEALFRADHILCLSNWHREFFLQTYPVLHPDVVRITRNGIDTSRYAALPVKVGNQVIFSSSPDRGLIHLLSLWPEIRKNVPDAVLNIFYGFDNWEKIAESRGDEAGLKQIFEFKQIIASLFNQGVRWHGRVSQKDLAEAQLASKVWAYPTAFTETSCISALECQAAGCVPVATHLAALPETVTHGFLLKDIQSSQYPAAFVRRVVNLLTDESTRKKFADAGRAATLARCGWDKIAAEWDIMFARDLQSRGPLQPYGKE